MSDEFLSQESPGGAHVGVSNVYRKDVTNHTPDLGKSAHVVRRAGLSGEFNLADFIQWLRRVHGLSLSDGRKPSCLEKMLSSKSDNGVFGRFARLLGQDRTFRSDGFHGNNCARVPRSHIFFCKTETFGFFCPINRSVLRNKYSTQPLARGLLSAQFFTLTSEICPVWDRAHDRGAFVGGWGAGDSHGPSHSPCCLQ